MAGLGGAAPLGEAELAQLAALLAGGATAAPPPAGPMMGAPAPVDPAMLAAAAGGPVPTVPGGAAGIPGAPGYPSTQPETYLQLAQQAAEADAQTLAMAQADAFHQAAALMGGVVGGAPTPPLPGDLAMAVGGPHAGGMEAEAVTPSMQGIAAELMGGAPTRGY